MLPAVLYCLVLNSVAALPVKRAPSNCNPTDAAAIIGAAQDVTKVTLKELQSVSGEITSVGPDISKLSAEIVKDCPNIVEDLAGCATGLIGDITNLGPELEKVTNELADFAKAYVGGWTQAIQNNDVQCIASASLALPADIVGEIQDVAGKILGGIFGGGGNSTSANAEGLLQSSDIFTKVSQHTSGSNSGDQFRNLAHSLGSADNSTASILDTLSQVITPFSSHDHSDNSQLNDVLGFANKYKNQFSDVAAQLQQL